MSVRFGFAVRKIVRLLLAFPTFVLKRSLWLAMQDASRRESILRYLQRKCAGKKLPPFLWRQRHWEQFLETETADSLHNRFQALLSGLDELSAESVRYMYETWLQKIRFPLHIPVLDKRSQVFPLLAEYAEQLRQIDKTVPFVLPEKSGAIAYDMARDCGLLEMPEHVRNKLTGRDIIDGGGYCGDSAMVFAKYRPKKIYCFEPNPDNFGVLRETLKINADAVRKLGGDADNIIHIPSALGKESGTLTLHSSGTNDLTAGALKTGSKVKHAHQCPMVSIDEFAKEHSLDVGLIKLDVLGSESDIIDGAIETITKHKPLLLIAVYHLPKDFFGIKPKIEQLGLGYRFMIRNFYAAVPEPLSGYILIGYAE